MRVSMGNWGEVVFCFALGGTCVVLPKAELGSANIIQGKDNTFVLPNTHLLYSQTHIYCCATAYTHIPLYTHAHTFAAIDAWEERGVLTTDQ